MNTDLSSMMENENSNYDCIVIGVGGMGSATCFQLAKRGYNVLGLEQYDIPHNSGSSHGITRIIRLPYYEDPSYVPLLRRAYELWDEIEQLSGEKLFHKTGSVDVGPADSVVFNGSHQSCLEHSIPHEVLSGKELNQRFPGYQVPDDYLALYQPDGGFLLPERATVAFVQAAQKAGAQIQAREQVIDWEANSEGVVVKTSKGTYSANSLVFLGGAWNGGLLPIVEHLAIPERQVLAWLQPKKPELFKPENFPVFNMQTEKGRYYGFPIYGIPGFKFGKYHHLEEVGSADSFDTNPNAKDEEVLRELAAEIFPDGNGPTMSLQTCMFTNSPDEHFIIDTHPDHPNVSFATGFSGHGYKFASVIGEIMADLALKHETDLPISLFSLDRFIES